MLGGIESISMEDYDKQMDVNVKSVFVLTKLALPHIIETKGNIINVSSVCGIRSVGLLRLLRFDLDIFFYIVDEFLFHLCKIIQLDSLPLN